MKGFLSSIATLVLVMSLTELSAQQVYLQDISGKTISERNTIEMGGSPYFRDEFLSGSIKINEKEVYEGLLLRYDMEADELVYRKPNSTTSMTPNGKVTEFTIKLPSGEQAFFKNIANDDKELSGFYQVLSDGEILLLKRIKRRIVEKVEYNSTAKTKSLITQSNYFVLKPDGSLTQVRADEKSILKALGSHREKLAAYVKQEKINFKKDNEFAKVVSYYNSIN